jgi:primase-polymerase (primpol)-like protein
VPFDPKTGLRADSTNPSTWSGLKTARRTFAAGGFAGIGFVLSKPHNVVRTTTGEFLRRCEAANPFTGIDLDDCIDADGNLAAWAQIIVNRFKTRTEISPSGTGVKLFIRGKLPRVGEGRCRCRTGSIEMYDRARFFTLTGRLLPGTPPAIAAAQEELDKFYGETFPQVVQTPRMRPVGDGVGLDDNALIKRACNSANGLKFRRLFYDGASLSHPSGSERDLALCSMLAFWCGPDTDRIDRLFRASALCDEKWETRADYRAMTITKAIGQGRDFYTPRARALVGEIRPKMVSTGAAQ